DQALTVLLRGGDVQLVDRVMLSSNAGLPTGAEVWVSTTGRGDADFTRVAAVGDLPNVNNLEHWVVFEPVAAKFVQVRLPASHGSTNYVGLTQLRVFSPERGGAADVPFVDLSRSPAGITGWAWDFGDGTTSTEPYPRHTFPGPGTYEVTLTVTDAAGGTATTSGTYTVPATASPTVVLSSPASTPLT